jgi:hypothetical protein
MNPESKVLGRRIRDVEDELQASKDLLRGNRKRVKKAKGKLARKNAKRSVKLTEKAVHSLEDYRAILSEEENRLTMRGARPR